MDESRAATQEAEESTVTYRETTQAAVGNHARRPGLELLALHSATLTDSALSIARLLGLQHGGLGPFQCQGQASRCWHWGATG